MDDTLADPLAGRLLDGRYAVTARIAHGGMATVYLAMDTRLDREVALKVMHVELARDDEFVRRFIGEAKSVARLSHQNVVAVFDQGADGPFLYLAMEYVPGRTLKELLRERGRFSPGAALDVMTGVLDGLAAAHASGIVHRDVKPENVLLTADGRVKVADFGLARAHAGVGNTRAGLLIGTVAYLPPEQVTGDTTGPRSDVYSAGVVLFELLTGRPPFSGDSPISVAYKHVNQDVPAPSLLVSGIPMAVDQLVLASTSRDPARRPADAGEFARAVRQVREGVGEPSGFIGVTGVGVQGLSEAPWLHLDSPAVTNGWWERETAAAASGVPGTDQPGMNESWDGGAMAPPGNGSGSGQLGTGQFGTGESGAGQSGAGQSGAGQLGTGQFGAGQFGSGQFGAGQSGSGQFWAGQFGTGQFWAGQLGAGGQDNAGSHTLVVQREEERRYLGSREPFLQRWLFSPRLAVIALIVVLGIGLTYGGWWFTTGRYAQVPSVADDTLATATAVLTGDGFTVTVGRPVHSNVVPKGMVAGTNPSGRVAKGSTIAILPSAGPFTSAVPKVTGDTLQAAEAALQRVHLAFTVEKVGFYAPVNTVLGTKPGAGTTWPQTRPVVIVVAAGPPIPDFIGMDIQAAQLWAAQHGAILQQRQDSNSQQQSGTITGQQPSPGSLYQKGEIVTIDVSTGPAEVNVPNPIGMTVEQATQLLEAAGFQVTVNTYGLFGDRVFDYAPVDQAPRGSTITLDVGL